MSDKKPDKYPKKDDKPKNVSAMRAFAAASSFGSSLALAFFCAGMAVKSGNALWALGAVGGFGAAVAAGRELFSAGKYDTEDNDKGGGDDKNDPSPQP
jgi:hypothetical protein